MKRVSKLKLRRRSVPAPPLKRQRQDEDGGEDADFRLPLKAVEMASTSQGAAAAVAAVSPVSPVTAATAANSQSAQEKGEEEISDCLEMYDLIQADAVQEDGDVNDGHMDEAPVFDDNDFEAADMLDKLMLQTTGSQAQATGDNSGKNGDDDDNIDQSCCPLCLMGFANMECSPAEHVDLCLVDTLLRAPGVDAMLAPTITSAAANMTGLRRSALVLQYGPDMAKQQLSRPELRTASPAANLEAIVTRISACGSMLTSVTYKCPVCCVPLPPRVSRRVAHFKSCARRAGLGLSFHHSPPDPVDVSREVLEPTNLLPAIPLSKSRITDFFGAPKRINTTSDQKVQQKQQKQQQQRPFVTTKRSSSSDARARGSFAGRSFGAPGGRVSGGGGSHGKSASKGDGSWSGGAGCLTRAPPYYKRLPGTSILVDAFQYAHPLPKPSTYFLTHFHADHYMGIHKSFNRGLIYCSEPTARLLQLKYGVDPLVLRPLPFGQRIVLPAPDEGMCVTLLE